VPTGTAFDLAERALKPGCPRPPSRATAQVYARQRPYDHWAVWANEWYAVDASPTIAAVTRAMRPLFEYDLHANLKMLEHMPLADADQVEYGKRVCALTPAECGRLGELYLLTGRNREAVSAIERWVALARDRVSVSNNVLWLVRFYDGAGDQTRAEATARMAAEVGSARGLDALGEWLDRRGRHDEAQEVYERIAARYANGDYLLGTFLWRKAAVRNDAAARNKAGELLRAVFPSGVEALQRHALDAVPADGAAFLTFGARPAALGLRATDVIVGVDDVRVRNARQFQVASRFSHDPAMKLTVWRGDRYEQVTARVPERLLGTRFSDYRRQ
jgi:tetratricopeptide (TPR) repeat protein